MGVMISTQALADTQRDSQLEKARLSGKELGRQVGGGT